MQAAPPRRPRSKLYDGWLYAHLIDPLSIGLHRVVAKAVGERQRVLDACCGTGRLSLLLAERCGEVVGVDLSPRNVAYAERLRRAIDARTAARVRFAVEDVAAHAAAAGAGAYNLVTCVMALHEMPRAARAPLLGALAAAGREILVVDFAAPMPWNAAGLRNRVVERAAGREHFGGFRSYLRAGGLGPLIAEAGLEIVRERPLDSRTLVLAVLRATRG